jgi:hypothetical protein
MASTNMFCKQHVPASQIKANLNMFQQQSFASATNLSLSLTLHDTNSPGHDVAWKKKSSRPQKE